MWSHLVYADEPDHADDRPPARRVPGGLDAAERVGIDPAVPAPRELGRHADPARYPLRPGPPRHRRATACRPVPGTDFGLRPAMTVRARVLLTKRVPAGQGVSYGHTYTDRRGRPRWRWCRSGTPTGCRGRRATSGPVRLAGANRTIAGRVCMDQVVLDCGDDPVAGRRRGRALRTRRRRRTHRGRLGRGGRHHQLRDRDPVRQRPGAAGLLEGERSTSAADGATRRRHDPVAPGREPSHGRDHRSSVVGAAAAGVAAGVAAERLLLRRSARRAERDPYRDEPFGELPADEYRTVTTDEGIPLHVEITGSGEGAADGGVRARLLPGHGHVPLPAAGTGPGGRVSGPSSYDQPGHGRSGRLEKGEYTLDLLGAALRKVIEETAPRRPRRARRPLDGRHGRSWPWPTRCPRCSSPRAASPGWR